MSSRYQRAYYEAAQIFAWFDAQFSDFTVEQCERFAQQSIMLGDRRSYAMLAKVKNWRLIFEDADVLKACAAEDSDE